MILVRDIFQLKFGKAREAMELLKQNIANMAAARGRGPDRILTDLTGTYYTLIMEATFNDLAEFDESIHKTFNSDDWRKTYLKFSDLVESGRREIFTIVPVEQMGTMRHKAETTARVGSGR
jgi:hypothetical protein